MTDHEKILFLETRLLLLETRLAQIEQSHTIYGPIPTTSPNWFELKWAEPNPLPAYKGMKIET